VTALGECDLMHIDGLARTLENSQGMVRGRKGKAVSLNPPACTRGLEGSRFFCPSKK
jgi:hypothetical protein